MATKKTLRFVLLSVTMEMVYSAQLPENVAVVEGNTAVMILESSAPSYVTWIEYVTKSSGTNIYVDGSYVYSGDPERGKRYSLEDDSSGSTVLQTFSISAVTLTDAGLYGVSNPLGSDGYAQLIVIRDGIQCSIAPNPVLSGSVVNIDCSIEYNGKWAPVMTCSSTELIATSSTDSSTTANAAISYSGTAPDGLAAVNVKCEAHFENPASQSEVGDKEALNIPSYKSEWTGTVNVQFPAKSIVVTPEQSAFDVNDVITCKATGGNPEPTYLWTDIETSAVLSTIADLVIGSDMAGKVLYVRCTATTSINGVDYELKTEKGFSVREQGTGTSKIVIITAPTMTGLLGLVAAVLAFIFCKKRAQRRKTDPTAEQ